MNNDLDTAENTASGLTSAEVEQRRQGLSNEVELTTSRPYCDIIKTNVFNPVNIVLYVIAFGMLLVGDTRSAITTVGLVVFNATVGIIQEVRAKRQLDEIALLSRSQTAVIRDGQEQEVYPIELVLGDVLVIRPGDQIAVDGQVKVKRRVMRYLFPRLANGRPSLSKSPERSCWARWKC